jgi:hypothetical protein
MENVIRSPIAVCDEPASSDPAIPQKRITDSADPTEDRSIMLVTEKRSQSIPTIIPPTIEVALKSDTSNVPVVWVRPIVVVEYEGRYVEGRKYPKLCMTFPACNIQNVVSFKNPRSRRRADADGDTGIRGFMNGKAMSEVTN